MLARPIRPAQDLDFDRLLVRGLGDRVAEAAAGVDRRRVGGFSSGGRIHRRLRDHPPRQRPDHQRRGGRDRHLPRRRPAAVPARVPQAGGPRVRVLSPGHRTRPGGRLRVLRPRSSELAHLGVGRIAHRARNRLHHRALRPVRRGEIEGSPARRGARRDGPPHGLGSFPRRGHHCRDVLCLPDHRFHRPVRARTPHGHRDPDAGGVGVPAVARAAHSVLRDPGSATASPATVLRFG